MGKQGAFRKRPAAKPAAARIKTPPSVLQATSNPNRKAWLESLPAEHPAWSEQLLRVFEEEVRQCVEIHQGREITLNMWSDCAGLMVEGFAVRRIAQSLRELAGIKLNIKLFCACELKPELQSFISANHSPKHIAKDMMQRDWEQGQFECIQCGTLSMPKQGIDIYVCGFPCVPWTPSGLRKGFDDANSQQCFAAIKTIVCMQPGLFFLENVMECTQVRDGKDFDKILAYIHAELPSYHVNVWTNVDPTQAGYPIRRARVIISGAHHGLVAGPFLTQSIHKVSSNPLPVLATYIDFLGLGQPLEWERLHKLPNATEVYAIKQDGCLCSFDPWVLCPLHPCRCKQCGANQGDKSCEWREKANTYINQHLGISTVPQHFLQEITYVQALELFSGSKRCGPTSPRERNMLNIIARTPSFQQMSRSYACMDISQSINRMKLQTSGAVPTIGLNTNIWVFAFGMTLNQYQIARLMGHCLKLEDFDSTSLSDNQLKAALGNGLHVACIGRVIFPAIMAAMLGIAGSPVASPSHA